ncbi:MAG: radical SAM protein [uncultured bacterium]|nr:MAG: radical SAM protein [uncultured bacterium]
MNNHEKKLILFIYPGYESLGIEYLSSYLKKSNYSTELIFDPVLFDEPGFLKIPLLANIMDKSDLIADLVVKKSPLLIAISATTDNWNWVQKLSKKIKTKKNIPIIVGGIHTTAATEICLQDPNIDFVCIGEGEYPLVELCNSLANKSPFNKINNIAYKKNEKIIKGEILPPISLDSLPILPDKELFYSKYPFFKEGYIISTSRGCPYHCTYCNNPMYKQLYKGIGKYYRKRSISHTIQELICAKEKYTPRHIKFLDESFNADPLWLKDFLKEYKFYINLPFYCFVFPDLIDETLLKLLKDAGCYKIQFGFQTSNSNIRKNILLRNSKNSAVQNLINLAKSNKIFTVSDTIIGIPGISKTDLYETAKFYNNHTPDHIEIFWLRFYPKTTILQQARKLNVISEEDYIKYENQIIFKGNSIDGDKISFFDRQMAVFLTTIPFIPKFINKIIIDYKLVKFFPIIPSILLIILKRLLRNTKYDLIQTQTYKRYLYFLFNKFEDYKP